MLSQLLFLLTDVNLYGAVITEGSIEVQRFISALWLIKSVCIDELPVYSCYYFFSHSVFITLEYFFAIFKLFIERSIFLFTYAINLHYMYGMAITADPECLTTLF